MKKIFYFIVAAFVALVVSSCSKEKKEEGPQKWEYKTLVVFTYSNNDFSRSSFAYTPDKLDELGNEGWELVDVYTLIETVHPNFGDSKYVTGLQPNTRDYSINYVFKRPCMEGNVESDHTEFMSSSFLKDAEEATEEATE